MLGLLLCHQRSFKLHAVVLPCCSVFTCKLQSKTLDQYGTSHVRTSRLHLVDLAGEWGSCSKLCMLGLQNVSLCRCACGCSWTML